ncbi:unnamed protein product [Penicillium egyptiacum]|uniref:Terpene synthase n=1 Tax=Penicillium egyptiacum TaxID=1303716 RepID=A0A9W4P1E9_9EURO|nr:unnamed protein product [Penicillium egyptiacum]
MSTIDRILEKFKDIVVRVPSMYSLSPSWYARVTPDLDRKVEEHVESWRQRWLLEPTAYKQNLAADCGYFARATNPNANVANLQIAARFTSWIFAWDDEPLQHLLCDELCSYVAGAVRSEDAFQDGVIMDLDVYLENRVQASAVYPVIVFASIVQDITLPAWFINHPVPKEMMRHINIMLSLMTLSLLAMNW